MPKPRPLTHVPTSYDPDQQLTPRTPHSGSRTSRLEQGFHKIPLSEAEANEADYDDQGALQSAPLLASSSTARFSVRNSRSQESSKKSHGRPFHSMEVLSSAISRLPLAFGIFMSGILLILVVLSITKPETLHRYTVGPKKASTHLTSVSSTIQSAHPSATSIHTTTNLHGLSYENYTKFPLTGTEYLIECAKQHKTFMAHGDYWDIGPMGPMDVEHHADSGVCSSTVTYMLDGTVGLAADLALMAQAAALARERNRTFFIDDIYWNRGKWQDHFEDVQKGQPGPQPGCKPPPPNELVACPRTARHWVITARTAKFHFGHPFSDHYEDPYMHNLNRFKPIYESSRQSLESVIRPNAENMELIELARAELSTFLRDTNRRQSPFDSLYMATHIRRGDRKSLSYTFPNRLIPVQDYVDAVKPTWTRLHSESTSYANPVVYVATDSPDADAQFSQLYNGETFSLFKTSNPRLHSVASPGEYYQKKFDELDIQSRIAATRGMVVDLAMVSGLWADHANETKPDAVICALSSTVCKLAAIGLGWDSAFGNVDEMGAIDEKHKRWVEIDQKGQIVPVWLPFELF